MLPALLLEPATLRLAPGEAHAFSARVRGLAGGALTWTVEEPEGGTVSAEGLYTAPAAPGTYHLSVCLAGDPAISATATLTVR